jgi:hypothetical protein
MDKNRMFSRVLRLAAAAGALMALVSQNFPAGAASPAVQAPPFIPVPNLAGYWNLDEIAGTTTNDSSGNNNIGSHYNGPVISTDVSPVPAGNLRSLAFAASGGTQRVNVSDSSTLRSSGPVTVAAWVKPSMDTPNYQKGILEKWTDGASAIDGYMFRLGWQNAGNNVPTFTLGNGTTSLGVATGSPLTNGQWAHVAGVYDGSTSIYERRLGRLHAERGRVVPTAANTESFTRQRLWHRGVHRKHRRGAHLQPAASTPVEVGISGRPAAADWRHRRVPIAGGNRISWLARRSRDRHHLQPLHGPSAGNYANVINNISTASYDDLSAATGGPTYTWSP